MNNKAILDKEDVITFLEYLLGHIDKCYYLECKTMIERFLARNNIVNTKDIT